MCSTIPNMVHAGGRTKVVTLGATPTQINSADPQVVSIMISPPSANRITISENANMADMQGIILTSTSDPLFLRRDDFGDLLTLPLYAIPDSGTPTIGIMEVHYRG